MKRNNRVLLGVTASVAIYKACEIVRRLKDKNFEVTVVMSRDAKEFISPLLFESLSGNKTYSCIFDEPVKWDIEHISLANWANVVLIAPATANCIAQIACGICDDLLTCVVSATKAPVIICPAMNENMFTNKITQGNIRRLKNVGYSFVAPRSGKLACGVVGQGCLADIETIVDAVCKKTK